MADTTFTPYQKRPYPRREFDEPMPVFTRQPPAAMDTSAFTRKNSNGAQWIDKNAEARATERNQAEKTAFEKAAADNKLELDCCFGHAAIAAAQSRCLKPQRPRLCA
jgi:hypothetical protein